VHLVGCTMGIHYDARTNEYSICPKTFFQRSVTCEGSTYLSRWKYEHRTLPVCVASTLRSGHASSRRKSQASCSAPAQTPTNRHIQIKATTQQQQQQQQLKSTDLLRTWGRGNILKLIYFTLSRIVHCLYRQHELQPTRWIKKGNAKSDSCIQYPACLQPGQTTRFECTIPDHFAACLSITVQLKGKQSVLCLKLSFMIFQCPPFFAFFWGKETHLH